MRHVLVGVLLAVVGMVAGQGMDAMPMHMTPVTDEYTFLAGMIPHHQEAVDTALVVLARGRHAELQAFAWDIVKAQAAEIAQMQGWLERYHPDRDEEIVYAPMMRSQEGLAPAELELAFLEDMIPHHEMAVAMAEELLANGYARSPGVAELAQSIIASQSHEIERMRGWLEAWYGVEVEGHGGHDE